MAPRKKADKENEDEKEQPVESPPKRAWAGGFRASTSGASSNGTRGSNKETAAGNRVTAGSSKETVVGKQARAKAGGSRKKVLTERNSDDSDDEDFVPESKEKKRRSSTNRTKKSKDSESESECEAGSPASKSKKRPSPKQAAKTPAKKQKMKKDPTETRQKNKERYLSKLTNQPPATDINSNQLFKRDNSINFHHTHMGFRMGLLGAASYADRTRAPVVANVNRFAVWKIETPFDRRVTALAWHPKRHALAAIGNKGGDLLLWNLSQGAESTPGEVFQSKIEGMGPGGSIQSLIFDELSDTRVYTASIDGTVAVRDFDKQNSKVFLNTNDWNAWYTGLDVCFSGKTMVAGRNNGQVTLLSLDGQEIWTQKLHKNKCNFVQFSQRQPWMVVTSSVDAVVKIWDIRNIKDMQSALVELPHDIPVNSAYFSNVRGDKLVTTDQHSQLRVYQGPYWRLDRTIPHPHRQFQHLTPIKACWHPLSDIVLAGRYPDPQFPGNTAGELRTIDFFCPDTGRCLLNLHSPGLDKIISLSQFNPSGDMLLSGAASSVLVWKARIPADEWADRAPQDGEDDDEDGDGGGRPRRPFIPEDQRVWPDFTKKVKKAREKKKQAD